MRASLALIISIFSFVLIDLNLIQKRRISSKCTVSITNEFEDKKTKIKKEKSFIKIESIKRKRDSKISTTSLKVRKQKTLDTVIIKSLEGCIEICSYILS